MGIAAFVGGMCPPAFGFGCAIVFNCFWFFFDELNVLDQTNDMVQLLVLVSLLNEIVFLASAIIRWHEVNLKLVLYLAFVSVCPLLGGILFVQRFGNSVWFKRGLGYFFFMILWVLLYKERQRPSTLTNDFNRIRGTVFGVVTLSTLISGFLAGLAGVGGPPNIVLVLAYNFDKSTFIGTYTAARALQTLMVLGFLAFGSSEFESDMIQIYTTVAVCSMFGAVCGYAISKLIDQVIFRHVLQFMLFCGSVMAGLSGTGMGPYLVLAVSSCMFIYMIYHYVNNELLKSTRHDFDGEPLDYIETINTS